MQLITADDLRKYLQGSSRLESRYCVTCAIDSCKREVVEIHYGCHRDSVERYIGKGTFVKHVLAIPVHLKDGSINLGSTKE